MCRVIYYKREHVITQKIIVTGKSNIQENKVDEGSELKPGYIAAIVVTVTIVAAVITVAMLCRRYGKTQCGFSTIFKNLSCGSDT